MRKSTFLSILDVMWWASNRIIYGRFFLSVLLECNACSRASPRETMINEAPTSRAVALPTASAQTGAVAPPPNVISSSVPLPVKFAPAGRVRIDWSNINYLVDFPASISEENDRIAAIVSVDDEGESFYPEWLNIKSLKADKIDQEIELIGPDLSSKLRTKCRHNLPACIPDVEQRVQAANAVLAKDRWRPFPCISIRSWPRPERTGPGCEVLSELTIEFQDPQLVISRGERRIVTRSLPSWSKTHRHPSCKGIIDSYVESVAFDPETGLFIITLRFVGAEGGGECRTPVWDFHPIRLPMFRRKALQKRDGGAL